MEQRARLEAKKQEKVEKRKEKLENRKIALRELKRG